MRLIQILYHIRKARNEMTLGYLLMGGACGGEGIILSDI